MRTHPLFTAFGFALCLPVAAAAQSAGSGPNRQSFTYFGERLTVLVDVDVPGTIRLIRGQGGRIDVAGRAPDGFTGFGLTDKTGDVLELTAIGADNVEYLVVVPEDTRVLVRLPDRQIAEVFGHRDRAATYRWSGRDR